MNKFNFSVKFRVVFDDLDAIGIVHNSVYIKYFERGRVEYLKKLGYEMTPDIFSGPLKTAVIENLIQYKSPAFFDEELILYLRAVYIKNSSMKVQYSLEKSKDNSVVATGHTIVVNLDSKGFKPEVYGDEFRSRVAAVDGEQVLV